MARNRKSVVQKATPQVVIDTPVKTLKKVRIDDLQTYEPITVTQEIMDKYYKKDSNLLLDGYPGTGKSFRSIYLALEEVLDPENKYKQLIIVRSAVPGRDIGFLKGDNSDKLAVYESPYETICKELFGRYDAYEALIQQYSVKFLSTSFNRGISLANSIIFVDEMQNMSFQELDTIITRVGKNSKIIFAGDYRQSDLQGHEKQGILEFLKILKEMHAFKTVSFGIEDIIRSDLVKDYIIAKTTLQDKKHNGL